MTHVVYIRNIFAVIIATLILVPFLAHAAITCANGQTLNADGICSAPADGTQPTTDPGASTPASAAAPYQFKNEGIFGCNQTAGASMSVGTLSAIGGVYVPVNDAAVTLNTGTLVYKECILRPLLDRMREAASAGLLKKAVTGAEKGRQGNKQYVENPVAERLPVWDKSVLTFFQGGNLDNVNPAFKSAVQTTLARNHLIETGREPSQGCNFQGDLKAAITNPIGQPFSFSNFEELKNPACNPYFAYVEKKNEMDARTAQALTDQRMMWDWGRGFYPVTDNAQDPLQEKVLTPASVVQESFQQILGSPVRQIESANDVGQMVGALFSGVTTQAITDSQGLAGLTQSIAGQPSYIDQVARESSQGVVGAAVNAALQILRAARAVESVYLSSMNAIATTLTQTIAQLRSAENQCWNLVVPKAKDYAASSGLTLDTNKIKLATSSMAFSQQVIDSHITSLATSSIANLKASQKALQLIDQLIAGVTNVSSLDAQRISLQQLDSLVAQKVLHTQYDAQRAVQQQDDVKTAMSSLVTDTVTAWADSTDPAVGWCNVNNPDVAKMWAERWKK